MKTKLLRGNVHWQLKPLYIIGIYACIQCALCTFDSVIKQSQRHSSNMHLLLQVHNLLPNT